MKEESLLLLSDLQKLINQVVLIDYTIIILGGDLMICKHGNYENGYIFTSTSTNKELREILSKYDKVRCVICNSNTAKNFRVGLWGTNIITINNKISDGCFFINQMR